MTAHDSRDLPEVLRRDVFRALVEAQDGHLSVAQSRTAVYQRYGLTERQLRAIEREGIANAWPPL